MARGGELYYLHLLQGLEGQTEKKETLEYLLNDLVGVNPIPSSHVSCTNDAIFDIFSHCTPTRSFNKYSRVSFFSVCPSKPWLCVWCHGEFQIILEMIRENGLLIWRVLWGIRFLLRTSEMQLRSQQNNSQVMYLNYNHFLMTFCIH